MYRQHIFLDFEMNPIPRSYRSERSLCRAEIIEIGAVRLDEDYTLTDRYSAFVRPTYGPIEPHITELTGITDEAVSAAPSFREALDLFGAWIGTERARIYSWSLSDLRQLRSECQLKEVPLPEGLCHRWMDFQRIYTHLVGLSERNALSLRNAIGAAESNFDGEAHRAVQDAENSASLLILVKKGDFAARTQKLRESLHPTSTTTLADTEAGSALAALLARMKAEE